MTGSSCTDDARVKVPHFKKSLFYNIKYSIETLAETYSVFIEAQAGFRENMSTVD